MRQLFQDISIIPWGTGPVYVRLAGAIREQIGSGLLAAGERLPPVREAAHRLGVNANTVQRAYKLLTQEGTLTSRPGAGTHVARAAPARPWAGEAHPATWLSARNQLEGIVRSVEASGVMAEVVIELPGGQEIVAAITRASAERLRLAPGEPAAAIIKSTDVMLARAAGAEDRAGGPSGTV